MEDGGRLISEDLIFENLPELKYMSLLFEQNIQEYWVNLKKKSKITKKLPTPKDIIVKSSIGLMTARFEI